LASTGNLYTREVLALATGLSQWLHDSCLPLTGSARSATCGSAVTLSLSTDEAGRITGLGLQASACAIGQASAALFAQNAKGRDVAELTAGLASIRDWLKDGGDLPDWPGFDAIAAARDYPARHGAITLAWQAAIAALSSPAKPG
jgi:NifU-like protein involved in Fe-S cluster formation